MAVIIRKNLNSTIIASRALEGATQRAATKIINNAKDKMLKEFEEHPATEEIKDGIDAENISQTLPDGYGNLTSFLGLSNGENQIREVENILDEQTHLLQRSASRVTNAGNKIIYSYPVSIPNRNALEEVSQMDWEPKSFLYAIEEGVGGFSAFLFGKLFPSSRSGGGIQTKKNIRAGAFRNISYISKILNNFRNRITKGRNNE
jgi:hypothetical protein